MARNSRTQPNMATKKTPSKAYAFAKATLEADPEMTYAGLQKIADKAGLKVPPILFAKAKLELGLVKRKKPRKVKVPELFPRERGRPRNEVALDTISLQIKKLQDERDRAVGALEKIREILTRI